MKTRFVELGFTAPTNIEYLTESLNRCARKGSVSISINKRDSSLHLPGYVINEIYRAEARELPGFDITIRVEGQDEGSVDDFCDFYLSSIRRHASERIHVESANYAYIDRVNRWLRAQNPDRWF